MLEEEATSSEPIPDPLLPRIVAFIQEFPEFLQTVVHCARKTELALWKTLFNTAGDPKDLFEVCLREGRLHTAASYLIVLQNMESAQESRKHATQLLEASLEASQWVITRDIVRFLKAIDPRDIDSPPRTPLYQKGAQGPLRGVGLKSPTAEEADAFVFQPMGVSRQRHSSLSAHSPTEEKSLKKSAPAANIAKKSAVAKTRSTDSADRRHSVSLSADKIDEENPVHAYLHLILRRHARELLFASRLRDLGAFAAHLDFHLVLWLQKERSKAARVQNFQAALIRLHTDFEWPFPLLSYTVVAHLNRTMSQQLTPVKGSIISSAVGSNGQSANGSAKLKEPLRVITRRNSLDSGVRTLDRGVSGENPMLTVMGGLAPPSGGKTKQLLMQQNRQELKLSPRLMDAQLSGRKDLGSLAEGTEMTEDSWMSPSTPSWETETLSTELDWEGLEQLCGEAASRGPQHHEAELRFLQQLMLEAACLEWSCLLSLILRDLVGLARAVNASTLGQAPPDTLARLRKGVARLDDWADQNCLGYKPLLHAVQKHLEGLDDATVGGPFDLSTTPEPPSLDNSPHYGTPSVPPGSLKENYSAAKLSVHSESSRKEKVSFSERIPVGVSATSLETSNEKRREKGKNYNREEEGREAIGSVQIQKANGEMSRNGSVKRNEWGRTDEEQKIHVDIVNPITPEEDKGQCAIM